MEYGSFRKLGVPCFGVLIIRILLFRVLYSGPLFSETRIEPVVVYVRLESLVFLGEGSAGLSGS